MFFVGIINAMKKIYFLIVALIATSAINAQPIQIPPMSSANFQNSVSTVQTYPFIKLVDLSNLETMPMYEIHENARVTSYSSVDSCHTPNCIMANGMSAQVGYVACPRKLSFGTRVIIDGDEYICGDRTAKRFDGRYDIFKGYGIEAHKKAISFGIKTLNVTIKKIVINILKVIHIK